MNSSPEKLAPPPAPLIHDVPTSMSPEIRDLWVMALRSDLYSRTRGRLREEDNFCPLGVLGDLGVQVGIATWEKVDGRWFLAPWETGTALPRPIQEWAGFTGMHSSQLVPLNYFGYRQPLYRLNDVYRLSFEEVADLIEAQY